MESRQLRILAIDDNQDNLTTLKAVVADAFPGARVLTDTTGAGGIAQALAEDPDLILLDIVMPGMDGFEVCRRLKADERLRSIPVVFLTALKADRAGRVRALESGAEGFLTKPIDEVELTAQVRAMVRIKDATRLEMRERERLAALVAERTRDLENELAERRRAEALLRESEEKHRILLDESPDPIFSFNSEGRYLYVNRAFAEGTGRSIDEITGNRIWDVFPKDEADKRFAALDSVFRTGEGRVIEVRVPRTDGDRYYITTITPIKDEAGEVSTVICSSKEITERKRAEEAREKLQAQLVQATKMESVGRLAGGVAHDFNNMLLVVLGHAEMALAQLEPGHPLHADLEAIQQAALHSADLTRQLLAFARRQPIAPRLLGLNDTVAGMLTMLRRLIGENIELDWAPGADLGQVKMDPSQIDQILTNLTVNARDAISSVGKITIETSNASFDEAYCAAHAGAVPGSYVMLAVSDNGCGMEKEVLDRLFEPFFTTKRVGQGTGLGLATLYGMVKQNEGFVNVYSEVGRGTTAKVYLPRHVGEAEHSRVARPETAARAEGETVLLVEDEEMILRLAKAILERLGYRVLTASTPGEGIHLAQSNAGGIHLLITDVVMPEMNGRDLAGRIMAIQPGIKCLYMSGYTANVILHQGVLDEGVQFIQKPFSTSDLAAKVREVLGQR